VLIPLLLHAEFFLVAQQSKLHAILKRRFVKLPDVFEMLMIALHHAWVHGGRFFMLQCFVVVVWTNLTVHYYLRRSLLRRGLIDGLLF